MGNYIVLVVLALVTFYPFLYVVVTSLSSPEQANQLGLHLFPTSPTLDSYAQMLSTPGLLTSYVNTVFRTVLGTAINVLLMAMVAYPLARRTFPHRKLWTFLLVFSMLFSGGLIPTYLLVKDLHLLNSIWALVLPTAVQGFIVIILRNFFQSIPKEIIESAKVDGASEWRILFRIVMPLSLPVLAVVGLWCAVAHWNAWFDALIYINDPDKQVVQVLLRQTVLTQTTPIGLESLNTERQETTPATLQSAMITFVMLPILLLYPLVQRYFVKGIMLGSVKG